MAADEQPRDHVNTDEEPSEEANDIQQNMKSRSTWVRALFMVVVLVVYFVSRLVVLAVIVLQFLYVLFTTETNKQLLELGHSLALFTCESIDFLTYNSESKPFPFDNEWPSGTIE
jgi:uncharacterized protein YqhQ